MRESPEFAEYLRHENMRKVCEKFHFKGFIGDQVDNYQDIFEVKEVYLVSPGLVEHCGLGQTGASLLPGLRLQFSD